MPRAPFSPNIYDFNTFDGDGEWTLAEVHTAKKREVIKQFEYADINYGHQNIGSTDPSSSNNNNHNVVLLHLHFNRIIIIEE